MSKGSRTARIPPPRGRATAPIDIQRAWSLYSEGRWAEAEPLCQAVLECQPNHAGVLTLVGVILAQTGRDAQAVEYLGRAAACMPDNPEAHNNQGSALRNLGKADEALSCYERALELKPDYVEAHYNRGLTLHDLARYGPELESWDRVLALQPGHAAAWNNRGAALHELGRCEEALASIEQALTLQPDYADARINRGAVLRKLERHDEAERAFEAILELRPDDPAALTQLGVMLAQNGRRARAAEYLGRAVARMPDNAEAHNNHGNILRALGQSRSALACHERALELRPDYAEAHYNRALALYDLGQYEPAIASCDRALALRPDYVEAHANRGAIVCMLRRFDEALADFDRALAIDARCAAAHVNRGVTFIELKRFDDALRSFDTAVLLGRPDSNVYCCRAHVLERLGRLEEAIQSYASALALAPDDSFLRGKCRHARMKIHDWDGLEADRAEIGAGLERGEATITPFALLSLLDSPALQLRAAEIWVREKLKTHTPLPPLARHPRHQRIRIGYFSADLRLHPVTRLAAGLFETHDRRRFELTAFSLGPDVHDELRTRVEAAFDRFLPVDGKSDREIAALARELEIDIAVDLGGYTHDARSGILALRAAPIQVSYLGYLGTLGSEHIDYLFADPVLVPAGSRRHYSEKIAYLPSYQVNDSKRPLPGEAFTRAGLGLPPEGFVFCCFNNSYKLAPEAFASWMRILAAVPGSVLYLLGGNTAAESNLRREARLRGIASERLLFGRSLPVREYLARYRSMDLFLDTLPYNAGTTASDALWAGLPVLTLPGEAFAARMAASILTAAGLPELIAPDRPAYERLAVELATDPRRLADLRQRIEAARTRCALFDTINSTRSIEALYEKMYGRYQAALPPDHLFATTTSS